MDTDDQILVMVMTAASGWVPPQVKAVFVERNSGTLTVHLGCDNDDERVRDAYDDILAEVGNQADDTWRIVGRVHESPDITAWRAQGWLPVHLSADWGGQWTEPCDNDITGDDAQEWTPSPQDLVNPEFDVRPANLAPYTEWTFLAALAHAAAGQITRQVRAVDVVVGSSLVDIYWHLDTPPDLRTMRAIQITARRLALRTDLRYCQRWYVHDLAPTKAVRWGSFFRRDDPRTWAQREADDNNG